MGCATLGEHHYFMDLSVENPLKLDLKSYISPYNYRYALVNLTHCLWSIATHLSRSYTTSRPIMLP